MDNRSREWRESKTHDAPEVHYTNYPVALSPDEQGLQVVEEDAKEYRRDGVAVYKKRGLQRRTWIWIAVATILCLVGFGAGVGVGIAVEQGSSEPTTTIEPSTTGTSPVSSGASSVPAEPVTSGTTGIADFSCNSTVKSAQYLNEGVTFTEECYCDYTNGGPVWNETTNSASETETYTNIAQYTVYSFQDCMHQCVDWNNERSPAGSLKKCLSVSYCANLTATVSSLAGNCFLKPARGVPYAGMDSSSLWASAYIIDD